MTSSSESQQPTTATTATSDSTQPDKNWWTSSDSGTEADDEGTGAVLKGLTAPPTILHPSRRGLSGKEENQPLRTRLKTRSSGGEESNLPVELSRRLTEAVLLLSVGVVVGLPESTRLLAWEWRKGIYILQVVAW